MTTDEHIAYTVIVKDDAYFARYITTTCHVYPRRIPQWRSVRVACIHQAYGRKRR